MTEQPNLDDWSDFSGVFLKAGDVKEFPLIVVCKNIEAVFDNGKPKLTAVVEYKGKDRKIGLNKTNQNVLRTAGLTPKAIIGKKLTFTKVRANNPITKQAVDSFLLEKVE